MSLPYKHSSLSLLHTELHTTTHLRNTWWRCKANEAKRTASAITRPPMTAVSLVLLRRHRATTKGAVTRDTARLLDPTQPVEEVAFG
ncbi:hypothetical protein E2C01_077540 [Portunus trituberculatus]|uniref:Uncharacterized protein n=1 Tax=Portunus trituberculatus TaxID=210409 RepID=A0A5B7IRK5_PORTR|nr:hypothetical protein [Portunus trituberculatus]